MLARPIAFALLLLANPALAAPQIAETTRWQRHAADVMITRDNWGVAHIRGRTDADAVFGMMYAQAEDDFNRIETNYLVAMGMLAQADGETAIWQDLRARLYMQPDKLKARFAESPSWLKRLMIAWADGLNHYLATHPETRPRVISRFEPWMALSFTEGSIGGDIERIDLAALASFYGGETISAARPVEPEPRGSNGFAIAPARTEKGHALLLINPHTSFFFRSEQQVTSDEGLNAYGAATWGQFFIYQGFNPRIGWMHTSSGVDSVDEFAETIERKSGQLFYRYGREFRSVLAERIEVPYRQPDGRIASRSFQVYRTHHGPIVRADGDKWIAFAMMDRPVQALQQSFLRTKARDYRDFVRVAQLKANASNNTILADAKGNIAYLHPQFIPRRNDRFDYLKPVDGSNPATDWQGPHKLSELPAVLNPRTGWIQNTNNWPYSAAGPDSPKPERFPRYMDTFGENPRGIHARMVLEGRSDFTIERLRAAAYDPYMPAFADLVPGLVAAWDAAPSGAQKDALSGPIAALRQWDYRWSTESIPTAIAVFWGEQLWKRVQGGEWDEYRSLYERMKALPAAERLNALEQAIARLTKDFGSWRTPWGEVNRFQRISPAIKHPFTDAAPSIPVGFTSARWGSLASFGASAYPGTSRWYGTSGNSFVAVVEFGDRIRARAVTAGGESGDPASPHFNDQAQRYATGDLREVAFYPDEIAKVATRTYRVAKAK